MFGTPPSQCIDHTSVGQPQVSQLLHCRKQNGTALQPTLHRSLEPQACSCIVWGFFFPFWVCFCFLVVGFVFFLLGMCFFKLRDLKAWHPTTAGNILLSPGQPARNTWSQQSLLPLHFFPVCTMQKAVTAPEQLKSLS